jgi:RNA polymerase sigma-70 factor (ECF subfamily)
MRKSGEDGLTKWLAGSGAIRVERDAKGELTELLDALRAGRQDARDRLVTLVYDELRRIAGRLMRKERPDHTLQPSALVHEALIRLWDGDTLHQVSDRRYFFTTAARTMRQVLIDHARRRKAAKRGGNWVRVPLDDILDDFEKQDVDVIDLNEALDRLSELDERQGLVVTLHIFAGMPFAEIADVLAVSPGSVKRDFRLARAFLRSQLGGLSG